MVCATATDKGHLDCLRYAHQHGGYWDISTCSDAAEGNHLERLKYAHDNGCSWDHTTCARPALRGSLACLRYAYENGCDWKHETLANAAENEKFDCINYAYKEGCPVPVPETICVSRLIVKVLVADIFSNVCRHHAAMIIQTEFQRRVSYNPHSMFGQGYMFKSLFTESFE